MGETFPGVRDGLVCIPIRALYCACCPERSGLFILCPSVLLHFCKPAPWFHFSFFFKIKVYLECCLYFWYVIVLHANYIQQTDWRILTEQCWGCGGGMTYLPRNEVARHQGQYVKSKISFQYMVWCRAYQVGYREGRITRRNVSITIRILYRV